MRGGANVARGAVALGPQARPLGRSTRTALLEELNHAGLRFALGGIASVRARTIFQRGGKVWDSGRKLFSVMLVVPRRCISRSRCHEIDGLKLEVVSNVLGFQDALHEWRLEGVHGKLDAAKFEIDDYGYDMPDAQTPIDESKRSSVVSATDSSLTKSSAR